MTATVPCPDCGQALAQDAIGVFCAGCGVRLYLISADGPLSSEALCEAVNSPLWGARLKPSKPTMRQL